MTKTELKWDERVYQIQDKFIADEFVIAYEDLYEEVYVFTDKVIIMEKVDHNFSVEREDKAIEHFTHLPLEKDLTQGNQYEIFSINASNVNMSEKENMYYMKEYVN